MRGFHGAYRDYTGWTIALDGQRSFPAMVAPPCETSHGLGFLFDALESFETACSGPGNVVSVIVAPSCASLHGWGFYFRHIKAEKIPIQGCGFPASP